MVFVETIELEDKVTPAAKAAGDALDKLDRGQPGRVAAGG